MSKNQNSISKKIIIIGGGLGGLASAALLAKDGHQVILLEKNSDLGGRASVWEKDGFKFDLGPSWYLMPDLFEAFFTELGESVHDHLKLQKLDPAYRIFFEEERDHNGNIISPAETLDVRNYQQVREYFEKLEKGAGQKFDQYMKISAYQYNIALKEFLPKSYNKLTDFLTLRLALEGSKMHVFESMDHYIQRFFRHPKIKKILEYSLVFLGSSPFKTPALYNIMNHVDFNLGVWYPQGGIFELTKTLVKLAEMQGAQIHLSSPVQKILVDQQGNACGVQLENGTELSADLVISNADYAFTETRLLDQEWQSYPLKYWQKRTWAPSAFMLYLGIKGKLPNILHHNLFFSSDWVKNFDDIFINKTIGENPSTYLAVPSKSDPSVAPAGCENLVVLIPVAPGIDINIPEMLDRTYAILEDKMHMPNLRESVIVERIFEVKDFQKRYNAFEGTALGLAHNLTQTAYFRPKQKSPKVKNLYYVGAGTHPGIGMPMVLLSAQILRKTLSKIT